MRVEGQEQNRQALERITASKPYLIGILPAHEFVPSLGTREFLHAGPPLDGWHEACGALRGSTLATLVHSGQASDFTMAEEMAASGAIRFRPANDCNVLGTYGGVIGRQTPLLIVENRTTGVRAGAALNEGRGKAVRYGSTDAGTLAKYAWLEHELAPTLQRAITALGGIDVFNLLEQALHMGDDGHSRHKAASSLLLGLLAAPLADTAACSTQLSRALSFIAQNDIFFLPVTMAAGKATMASAQGLFNSSVVTCMAANGVRIGIKTSAASGRWYTAPVPRVKGVYFSGFDSDDAGPMIGDSIVAETMGLGAFAMAAAPALASYVGGTPQEATRLAMEMYAITLTEHPRFTIPSLGYRGTALGIDAVRVVETGIEPIFNTGIAHKQAGIGQIGAGFGRVPVACFQAAVAESIT
jgi:hypothetical protein